jgi:hypothetical protein
MAARLLQATVEVRSATRDRARFEHERLEGGAGRAPFDPRREPHDASDLARRRMRGGEVRADAAREVAARADVQETARRVAERVHARDRRRPGDPGSDEPRRHRLDHPHPVPCRM